MSDSCPLSRTPDLLLACGCADPFWLAAVLFFGDPELPAAVLGDCGNDATGGISLGGNRTGGPLTILHLVEIESMESNDRPATGHHLPAMGSSPSEFDSSGGLVWHELAGGL